MLDARDTGTEGARRTADVERPTHVARVDNKFFGSDYIADILRELEIPFIALNPGASYRGLHDSIVNHLGNKDPQILVCLHEEHAVAIAHGYAKVTERPLAVALHSNVGLMHASMAIFNAYCDRMPVLLIGATGPLDAEKRRPWIDWIHTAQDQGSLIRNFIKWDDQPTSVGAAREAILRAYQITSTRPAAPVYVNIDAEVQEQEVLAPPRVVSVGRYRPISPAGVPANALDEAMALLTKASSPMILAGRVSRSEKAWRERLVLAETLKAKVATDTKVGASFPTHHDLHSGEASMLTSAENVADLLNADVILDLDSVDLAGTFKVALEGKEPAAKVISVGIDHHLHMGWSKDHQALPSVDLRIATDPDTFVSALVEKLGLTVPDTMSRTAQAPAFTPSKAPMTVADLGAALRFALKDMDTCLVRLPLSWSGGIWPFDHPLDYLGSDGGGGIGSGPGMAVGAALALKDTERLPVAILGDGDFMMGCTAIWTAVHYHIPLLIIVANNHSYFNDEMHQERMAVLRCRPVENKTIGLRMEGPALDIAKISEAQGARGFGPVTSTEALQSVLAQAIAAVAEGSVVVVDAHVQPGYGKVLTSAMRGTSNLD